MASFIGENFLLKNKTSIKLYHEYAKDMPIYDYHCHIEPSEILKNKNFENITELWLSGDHYKWRLMRSNAVDESYITGNKSDREKFQKFAETLPLAIGNPMYHWCHMELKNYFGYDGVLNGQTAQEVWDLTNAMLKQRQFNVRNIIEKSNVAMIGTTDDPCSDLYAHKKLAALSFSTKVYPSFRPDNAINIHKKGFRDYIIKLAKTVGYPLNTCEDVVRALYDRMKLFNENGCRAADHGLDYLMYKIKPIDKINETFSKAMSGEALTIDEQQAYQTYILLACGREYRRMDWAMQLHFNCMRNPNSIALKKLGNDSGFDCILAADSCRAAYRLMDALERENSLPKTIMYSLNPADNEWIDTLLGAFQGDEIPSKIQHGCAWWFNDHKKGIVEHLTSLASLGILGNFIGMLTDSRSFLSYARHEYFRRILCNLIGEWVENGEYPNDIKYLGLIVQNICSNNARRYFNL